MSFLDHLTQRPHGAVQDIYHQTTMDRAMDLQRYSPNMKDTLVFRKIKEEGILAGLLLKK